MKRWLQTGATLLFGAGLGVSVSRLLSVRGRQEEKEGVDLLSRIPVVPVPTVPVPTVQASELTVSVCVCVCVCVLDFQLAELFGKSNQL